MSTLCDHCGHPLPNSTGTYCPRCGEPIRNLREHLGAGMDTRAGSKLLAERIGDA